MYFARPCNASTFVITSGTKLPNAIIISAPSTASPLTDDSVARAPQRSNAMPTGICATSSARKNAPPAKPTSRALRPSATETSGPITLLDTR